MALIGFIVNKKLRKTKLHKIIYLKLRKAIKKLGCVKIHTFFIYLAFIVKTFAKYVKSFQYSENFLIFRQKLYL